MQKNNKFLYYLISILFLSTCFTYAQNFIVNGDFESGGNGVGFNVNGAGYSQISAPFSGTTIPGNYAFTTNPQPMNTAFFISGGDHTTGSGNMMVIDGNTTGGQQRFWRAGNTGGGVTGLTIGTTYTFSFWLKSVASTVTNNATRADLGLQFNNASNITLASGVLLAPLPASGWQQIVYTIKATSTSVNIEIFNNNINTVGNDFAVDDFSLVPTIFPLSLTYSTTYPSCPGAVDAALVAYGVGGVPPYVSYSLTGPTSSTNTTGIFTGLAAGTYSLSVTDFAGTTFNQPGIVINAINDLIVSPDSNLCSGSPITLNVSGSTAPYTWTASPSDPTLTTPNSSNPTVSPLVNTTYTVTSSPSVATNLVYNGNFTLGNVGFNSDYEYLSFTVPTGQQKTYGITTNSQSWFPGFSPCTDHTSPGTGKMMVVDGSTVNAGNDKVWCQTIPVTPGQNYTFSYWVQTVAASPNLANLEVLINGTSVGLSLAPATTCNWVLKSYVWNSGISTTAQICIYDRSILSAGNDFAIDDISFIGNAVTCNLSKSVTITVLSSVNLLITNPAAVCAPSTVDITTAAVTAGSTTGTTLTYWTNAAATVPLLTPNAISVSGTYYIKSTLATCFDIKPVVVSISSLPPPVVTSPVNYCQNSTAASALIATALPGNTLNWYGTNATGGTASPIPPIPSTTTIGTTTYYVSQTNGVCESSRAAIVVNITAAGGPSLNLFCADVNPTYINFDFSNVGQTSFTITYSIAGGPPITVTWFSPSNYDVTGLSPGQSVTFTISANGVTLCTPVETVTCNSTCTTTIVPNFAPIAPFCTGTTAPTLATTSPNGVVGTWLPSTVSNTTSGSYVFTPNSILNPCATTQTLNVTVLPLVNPVFTTIPSTVCQGSTALVLPTISSNTPPINGTWSPASVNTSILGNTIYTFTPNTGQCTSATLTTASITVVANVTPNFAAIPAFCSGTTAPLLTSTSPNGITGTWSPAIINNTTSGSYVFTPNAGQCATTQTLNVTVTPITSPNFAPISPICSGDPAPILNTTSPNGISGVWNPSIIDNITGGNYVFTPDVTLFPCATTQTLIVTILPRITPVFTTIPTSVCLNGTPPLLPTGSSNTPPISGTWNPATVNTTVLGSTIYTFTPNAGQCTAVVLTTVTITITPNITPDFLPIAPFCSGSVAPLLTNTSPNGITGTWSPAIINNSTSGSYVFTPNAGQCATTQTLNVTVTPITSPNFVPISPICSGDPSPILNTTAPNGISGVWNPSIIDNITGGNYVFTPDVVLFPCATTQTLVVTILPRITPVFTTIPTSVCLNGTPPLLPTGSSNTPPISGIWNPATVNTTTLGSTTYTFTPNPGQCTSTTLTTVTITVTPNVVPDFLPIAPFCTGTTAPVLSNTSPNGIVGTWYPPTISNTTNGNYVFTPIAGQCATNQTLSVTILAKSIPDFPQIPDFCAGSPAPVLATTSPNGINGTWSPSVVSNTLSGAYVFIPDASECSTGQILIVNVLQPIDPDFEDMSFCSGSPVPSLNTTSPNGITGTWVPSTINNTTSGTYVFTPNASECATIQSIFISINVPTLTSVDYKVSEAFQENQVITVTALAAGNYLYQLDNGNFQSSNVFEYVSPGTHTITVMDANGCSQPITITDVIIIDYPKFFTPNGDNYNETWNIFSLAGYSGTKIFIFDRYGKLLKQISPNGSGWDGTYNGQNMPSSDYWFRVEFYEDNVPKVFNAHFSLKR